MIALLNVKNITIRIAPDVLIFAANAKSIVWL